MPSFTCDVGDGAALDDFLTTVERDVGPIDLMCSNAAYGFVGPDPSLRSGRDSLDAAEDYWDAAWRINVLAHIRAARKLVPLMVERGGGYFLPTVSAAGLITANSGPAYTVTKHADIGFAEWLLINYRSQGIGVSCICPTAIQTRAGQFDATPEIGVVQTPEEVAQFVVEGLAEERFLILPNPAVGGSFRKKATDYDAWIDHTVRRLEAMRQPRT
jgi:NAD(P)-dependent dehydrogenase (short-subunit alcohol dehydrogenase family)